MDSVKCDFNREFNLSPPYYEICNKINKLTKLIKVKHNNGNDSYVHRQIPTVD